MTNMDYSKAAEWKIAEKAFNPERLGKCEAIMCQGNGYLGLRNATDEFNAGEQRNLFVAGTFNKFDENEVTELPNAADVTRLNIRLDGVLFNTLQGEFLEYSRELCLKDGQVVRTVVWESPNGNQYRLEFRRFVSMARKHIIAQQVLITPLSQNASVTILGGINGQMSNTGVQHFSDGVKRLYDSKYMQYTQTTTESKIVFLLNSTFSFRLNGVLLDQKGLFSLERRLIQQQYHWEIPCGNTLNVEKISNVFTSRDLECRNKTFQQLQQLSLENLKEAAAVGYERMMRESAEAWDRQVWDNVPVTIESSNPMDQLAIRFAQYHMYVMTPSHDNRMNVGAKGLSGEAYKGHTFWDTEMFILPYFIYSAPEIARSLEEYRYLGLKGARQKAASNNYEGAMFPWEAAWIDDGEVTPVWGSADVVTGLPIPICTGFIEQHITSDVAFGAWQYYTVTGDQDFMDRYGYELILDTAKFWASRLEEGEDGLLHINDVVGPDEYKEHIDDNAFTNYMAVWNMKKAMEYAALLKEEKPEIYARLAEKLDLSRVEKQWEEKVPRVYLPQPREDGVIPQDRTYLDLQRIDLTKYKNQQNVGTIGLDFNMEQINSIQVSKQADIMIMFLLLENQFDLPVKQANWDYYEPLTLHDSSLSLSTHTILANDMGNHKLAYDLFQQAAAIDMGPNMKTSDAGIHAASIAGIWQSVVFGFGGMRMLEGKLRINPNLPDVWDKLSFFMYWKGQKLHVEITKDLLQMTNMTNTDPVVLTVYGKEYAVNGQLSVRL